jgi:hypothetical protein
MHRTEINVTTGEIQTIELTSQEIAQLEKNEQAWLAEKAQEDALKASALAKLAALGLTQDEVKALVG